MTDKNDELDGTLSERYILGSGVDVIDINDWEGSIIGLSDLVSKFQQFQIRIDWRSVTESTSFSAAKAWTSDFHFYENFEILNVLEVSDLVEVSLKSYGEDDDVPGRSGFFVVVSSSSTQRELIELEIDKMTKRLMAAWLASEGPQLESVHLQSVAMAKDAELKREKEAREKVSREAERQRAQLPKRVLQDLFKFNQDGTEQFFQPTYCEQLLADQTRTAYLIVKQVYADKGFEEQAAAIGKALKDAGWRVVELEQTKPHNINWIPAVGRKFYRGWRHSRGLLLRDEQVAEDIMNIRERFKHSLAVKR